MDIGFSSILLRILLAAVSGGILCAVAQAFINLTSLTPARILVFYVVAGVALYALGIYEPLLSLFGCGISLPLIGFGGTIGKGVREAVMKDGILGAFSGSLSSASVGITIAILLGFILSLIFKSKPKRT